MRRQLIVLAILLTALVIRLVALGSFPRGLTWDEAAIGYNAYSIATTRRDEWLHRLPLSFQSFGDYKSPLGIYITAFFVLIGGVHPFVIRLPVALAGTSLVLVSYLLMYELLRHEMKKDSTHAYWGAVLCMVMVACSPWAIHFSRIGFESMIATALAAWGVWFFLRARSQLAFLFLAAGAFSLSLYAYHSAKLFVPLLVISLAIWKKSWLLRHQKKVLLAVLMGILIIAPLGYASIKGKANDRALSTTIISTERPVQEFIVHYLAHLSPDFLLRGQDTTYRHSTFRVGVFYPIELLLLVIGVIAAIERRHYKLGLLLAGWILLAIVPGAIGKEVPHANRTLMALPYAQMLATLGAYALYESVAHRQRVRTLLVGMLVLGIMLQFGWYVHVYTKTYQTKTALAAFGYGYDTLMPYVRAQESTVQTVYFTNAYSQAYIYILFYKQLSPIAYQGGGLANYVITTDVWNHARGKTNVLIVGTDAEIPDEASEKDIRYPDGSIVFQVARL